ncbi:MAG: DsbA family oxidoreductase [Gammaproteobacteria bacterium]|nr:MAG: DsbA family oxidoreductase [Gammaproteobacteria bacterium]
MRIDFISDISCPWCALGLASFKKALDLMGNKFHYDLHFQPFELNTNLSKEGKNLFEYLSEKYGMDAERIAGTQQHLRERGDEVGFMFGKREHIWNSFDAHRLLYWAELELGLEEQYDLKMALLRAYHSEAKDISDHDVLIEIVLELGLDRRRADIVLTTDLFGIEVRELEQQWQELGINAVPSIVINREQLIQGAQPVDVFVGILMRLKSEQVN